MQNKSKKTQLCRAYLHLQRRRLWLWPAAACAALVAAGAPALMAQQESPTVPSASAPPSMAQQQQMRRDFAAAQACPRGHAVQWLDATTMTCLREVAP